MLPNGDLHKIRQSPPRDIQLTMTAHHAPPQSPTAPQDYSQPVRLKVIKGALIPASEADVETLRKFRLRVGHTVLAQIDRPRHPEGLRVLHGLAQAVSQNIAGFEHLSAHQVIKRLQAESGVGCELISVPVGDMLAMLLPEAAQIPDQTRMITAYRPKSLSMSTMDDSEFQEIFDGLCRYLACRYWSTLTIDGVAQIARLMPDSVP